MPEDNSMKVCKGVKGHPCRVTQEEQPLDNFYKNGNYYRGYCKVCNTFMRKLRYQEDPSVILSTNARSYEKNKEAWSDQKREYYKEYSKDNKQKELKRKSDWKKLNKGKVSEQSARRRSSLLYRTPSWLSEGDYKKMQSVYAQAQDCSVVTGEPYHVDHIVPLNGENVCGLHVPWNLQVLPADINIAKSNSHD